MPLNKDFIIRVLLAVFLIIAFVKVVGPVLFDILKRKLPGNYDPNNDIDSMIRNQKNRLRAQYGLTGDLSAQTSVTKNHVEDTSPTLPASPEAQALFKEARWGGGQFTKDIQSLIAKNYSYTLVETKVNAFLLLAEKRGYVRFMSAENQKSPDAIKNFLSLVMLFLILIEEIRNKELSMLEKMAKKSGASTTEFMLALQLQVLFTVSLKRPIKEERLFESTPALHQYSEETIKEAMDAILKKQANFWAKGHSHFFEELTLYLSYAELLVPYPALKDKKDLTTAYAILKVDEETETDEIKKVYKKLAMTKHPDKIVHLKLPKILEKKAHAKFNSIQEAYDIILSSRKKQ